MKTRKKVLFLTKAFFGVAAFATTLGVNPMADQIGQPSAAHADIVISGSFNGPQTDYFSQAQPSDVDDLSYALTIEDSDLSLPQDLNGQPNIASYLLDTNVFLEFSQGGNLVNTLTFSGEQVVGSSSGVTLTSRPGDFISQVPIAGIYSVSDPIRTEIRFSNRNLPFDPSQLGLLSLFDQTLNAEETFGFSQLVLTNAGGNALGTVDSVVEVAQVPEPGSSVILLALSSVALLKRRRNATPDDNSLSL